MSNSFSEPSTQRQRRFYPNLRAAMSESIMERVRSRTFRIRFHNLGRLGKPLKIMLFVLVLAALSYLAIVQLKHLFFGTSYFEIRSIEVEGISNLSREETLRLAGIAPGTNIINLDRESVRRQLLLHPLIKDASVEMKGLSSVRLRIDERKPFVYIKSGTTFFEISDDGVIISKTSLGERDLTIITGIDISDREIGDSINNIDAFLEVKNWISELTPKALADISEFNFSKLQNPYIFLSTGEKVFPKSLEDFKERHDFLRALLDNLKKNGVEPEYLDMRAPTDIVVKLRRARNSNEGVNKLRAGG